MTILIFKLGAIGDVIMSLPALVMLRKEMPHAHITWVADKPVLPILEATGLIDKIYVLEEGKLMKGTPWARLREVLLFWSRLGIKRYDQLIIGHADSKVNVLLLPVSGKSKKMFNRDGTKWNTLFPVPGRHHSHEFIKLFVEVPYPNATPITYPILDLPELDRHRLPDRPFITLAPGGTQSSIFGNGWLRRWPIEKYVDLAQKLHSEGHTIALIGGKDDDWVKPYFKDIPVFDYIGKFALLETIQFLTNSRLLITNDCGPMHFAALANTPVVGIFGPTNPNEKIPLHHGATYVWGGAALSCRPCYDNKVYAPCKHNECLTTVSVDLVLQHIKNVLQHEEQIN